MHERLVEDPDVTVWCLSQVEVWSAVARRRHDGLLRSPDVREARKRLEQVAAAWVEIDDVRQVRERARRILETHRLRAADALQLGAALVVCNDRPGSLHFLTLDQELQEAAEREGFVAPDLP
jgi:predicted nucleic acid-binding protein